MSFSLGFKVIISIVKLLAEKFVAYLLTSKGFDRTIISFDTILEAIPIKQGVLWGRFGKRAYQDYASKVMEVYPYNIGKLKQS